MFISRSMTAGVVTTTAEADILEARALMAEHGIRHLPVVKNEDILIGIITDRDIRSALPYEFFKPSAWDKNLQTVSGITVGEIMTPDPITVDPMDTIQDALLMMQKEKVGAFPVSDSSGHLMGIISIRDLLRAFTNVLGIGEPGTLLCILVEEKIGQLKKIVDAITEENISFGSVLVARYWEEGKRVVFPYLLTTNVGPIKRKLENMGYTLLNPMEWYMDTLPRQGHAEKQ
jgi:acetoin utilization protein AcuB